MSILKIPVPDHRPLNTRELTLLKSIFGDAVEYNRVVLQKGGLLTLRNQAVAWENRVRFPAARYKLDFINGDLSDACWLVHEITHVWQWQNVSGYHPLKAAQEHLRGSSPYNYNLDAKRPLTSYGWEQQASIVEHYCRHSIMGNSRLEEFEAVVRSAIPQPDWAPPREAWASLQNDNIV